jgi:hypothetical protein
MLTNCSQEAYVNRFSKPPPTHHIREPTLLKVVLLPTAPLRAQDIEDGAQCTIAKRITSYNLATASLCMAIAHVSRQQQQIDICAPTDKGHRWSEVCILAT